jgi:hypothetical protein
MHSSPANTQLRLSHLPDSRPTACTKQPLRPRPRHITQHTKRTLRVHKNMGRSEE